MLQSIREKSQGWFAWTIVLAICIPFAFWGAKSYLYGNEAQNTVAKVNGVAISKSDVI
jgi:peptidyl-prolyl cis-trans isomerase D